MPRVVSFKADHFALFDEVMDDEIRLVGIFVGQGTPEDGGEHWNFSRSVPDDDHPQLQGVCTVKEIQRVTHYGGILRFVVSHTAISCMFTPEAAAATGYAEVHMDLEGVSVDADRLAGIARILFPENGILDLQL